MNRIQSLARSLSVRGPVRLGALAGAVALVAATGVTAAASASASDSSSFTFKLVPSPGIAACLPHAGGSATITTGSLNDTMKVSVHGFPAGTGLDLFVIQTPSKPFGLSWYQSDVNAGSTGSGSATVRGIFDAETFTVSPGGTVTVPPTHQYHLGLWFNNPNVPFKLGCEPGATTPVITPFNGAQHAGIQALNTANFPDNAGPLSLVHR